MNTCMYVYMYRARIDSDGTQHYVRACVRIYVCVCVRAWPYARACVRVRGTHVGGCGWACRGREGALVRGVPMGVGGCGVGRPG